MNTIIKRYESETAHIVRNAVSDRCKYNIHGHSYIWEVELLGEIQQKTGMVLDFKQLEPIKLFIDKFDHSTVFWLGEDPAIIDFFKQNFQRVLVMQKNCTAENMARLVFEFTKTWLLNFFPDVKILTVRVWETRTGSSITNESDPNDRFSDFF